MDDYLIEIGSWPIQVDHIGSESAVMNDADHQSDKIYEQLQMPSNVVND